jgi:hypothetical protein
VTATLADREVRVETVDPQRARLGFGIWALLFFNGLAFNTMPMLIPIPNPVGKLLTQSALALALLLVLVFNRDRLIRPNLFLTLYSLVAIGAIVSSVHLESGKGSLIRSGRFLLFVAVLWLLTPLWGRRDRILMHWHLTCMTVVLATVAVGAVIAPGRAFQFDGRLAGQLWPIPPTQVGHYAAILAGVSFTLLIAGAMNPRRALLLGGFGIVMLLLTHTRTALVALVIGATCAILTLITSRKRARRAALVVVISGALLAGVFSPLVSTWFSRGEGTQRVSDLNGRAKVWDSLKAAPRSDLDRAIGVGLTDKSFGGLPIDNSWYAAYWDQGLLGVVLCAAILISLLLLAATRPRGPSLAVALFIIVYCCIASWTETGLADVSPYILDLTVAASLLAAASAPLRKIGSEAS